MLVKILLTVGVAILVLIVLVAVLGTWGGAGNLFDFIAGQFPAKPRELVADISLEPGAAQEYVAEVALDLETPLREVPPEYLSFALDLSQLVGGKWWNPEAEGVEMGSGTVHAPVLDLADPQFDRLAAALAPAYLRFGGSESDKCWYDMVSDAPVASDAPEATDIPAGYESAMTRAQWDAAAAFCERNGLEMVFCLNAGPSARGEDGAWDSANAEALLAHAQEQGHDVAVWELGNELNISWFVHGLDVRVPRDHYLRDVRVAEGLVRRYDPDARFAAQGSAYWPVLGELLSSLFGYTVGVLCEAGDATDLVVWHYYPQQSRRGPIASRRAHPARLLNPDHLDEAAVYADRLAVLRDRHAPDAPLWLGETGNAQFGGEPGVSDAYIGGLWWLDQLGLLARHHHDVVIRQTLMGMDYGMLESETLAPRPDYWNSLLWKRLMGRQVYEARVAGHGADRLRVYCHNTPGREGHVTLLAINLDPEHACELLLPAGMVDASGGASPAEVFSLNAPDLQGHMLLLNGERLVLREDGALPEIVGASLSTSDADGIILNPLSYAFLVLPIP